MCGIAGYVLWNKAESVKPIFSLLDAIAHRGPDGRGVVVVNKNEAGKEALTLDPTLVSGEAHSFTYSPKSSSFDIALGQCRYAVVDLSPNGLQPFIYEEYALTFNGEIYNFLKLREDLKALGYTFKTNTDTEVFLHAYRHWGLECFQQLRGPFAGAIVDNKRKKTIVFRDKLGKNPLYYTYNDKGLWWASEIKALLEIRPELRPRVNKSAIANFIRFGIRDYSNENFWEEIYTFPQASYLELDFGSKGLPEFKSFWQLPQKRLRPKDISLAEAVNGFRSHMEDAIRIRMHVDLKMAFTLSGGLDSSAIAQSYFETHRHTAPLYTIRFNQVNNEEEKLAKLVVANLPGKPEHIFIDANSIDLLESADEYFHLIEQPFHAPALFADHYLQGLLKKEGIGVVINGAGGDELMAGYEMEYGGSFLNHTLLHNTTQLPAELMAWMSKKNLNIPAKVLILLGMSGVNGSFLKRIPKEYLSYANRLSEIASPGGFTEKMLANFTYLKMHYWLNSGNLNYLSIPIEARAPLLDADLADYCFRLPPEYLMHNGWTKYILRKAFDGHLPDAVNWNKVKMGYPFPLSQWLLQHADTFKAVISDSELEGLDKSALIADYQYLVQQNNGARLWRYICVLLWHRRMVVQYPLNIEQLKALNDKRTTQLRTVASIN